MQDSQATQPYGFNRLAATALMAAAGVLSTGCANLGMSLPSGGDSTNQKFFKNDSDMMERVGRLTSAIKDGEVLTMDQTLHLLDRKRLELNTMNRTAIRGALEGTGSSPVPLAQSTLTEEKLSCKEGLSFQFSNTNSAYAFDNPIKWQQATKGFSYKVDMIFNSCTGKGNPSTLETVIVEGGPVDTIRRRTVFDLLNASQMISPRIGR